MTMIEQHREKASLLVVLGILGMVFSLLIPVLDYLIPVLMTFAAITALGIWNHWDINRGLRLDAAIRRRTAMPLEFVRDRPDFSKVNWK